MITVIKRDKSKVAFESQKIIHAIKAAALSANENISMDFCLNVVNNIVNKLDNKTELTVEEIQNYVEQILMHSEFTNTAKRYIIYRHSRDKERETNNQNIKTFNEIVNVANNDINRENANMNAATPAGMMMKFASETTKEYALKYLMNATHAIAHRTGNIHVHDLDFYPTGSTTCLMMDLIEVLKNGFDTNDGAVREPKSVRTAAQLAAIALQCNQNEQHGGQAIGNWDYAMAKYVKKSFVSYFKTNYKLLTGSECTINNNSIIIDNKKLKEAFPKTYKSALDSTKNEIYQAMEAFMHNMVTMHSRGGCQIVFSSINYGTDISTEGRMVINALLDVTERGAGPEGSTFIFPIQIFKVKKDINFCESDWQKAIKNWDKAMKGEIIFSAPNFDLFLKACKVSAKRLFPNFIFLDSTFNYSKEWNINDPMRYMHETCTMGCRTRIFDNLFGPKTSMARGNLSFSTINIVRIAIEAKNEAKKLYEDKIEQLGYNYVRQEVEKAAITLFFEKLDKILNLTSDQLYIRYLFQSKRKAKQFPFLLGQNLWKDGSTLKPNDHVESVIKHGTLSIGFIGLAETLVMLIEKHHGQSEKAQELGLSIVRYMRTFCDSMTKKHNLNFSLLATPAEGLSGRFVNIDRAKYGSIKGVTDREYYTNSNHVPVYFPITAIKKIAIESAYHELTNGGHILYVEMDAEAKKNIIAFATLIRQMFYSNTGYGAINHEIKKCLVCGHEGTFEKACPLCGEEEAINTLARITGYLVGNCEQRWSNHKLAEKRDRVKHVVG